MALSSLRKARSHDCRIEGMVNGVDTPPDGATSQMHRYCDAI